MRRAKKTLFSNLTALQLDRVRQAIQHELDGDEPALVIAGATDEFQQLIELRVPFHLELAWFRDACVPVICPDFCGKIPDVKDPKRETWFKRVEPRLAPIILPADKIFIAFVEGMTVKSITEALEGADR